MNLDKRIKYLEDEFNSYYKNLREASSYLFDIHFGMISDLDSEKREFSEYWTHEYLQRMYYILCVYFETLGLNDFLADFKFKYKNLIEDRKESIKISYTVLKYGDFDEDLYLLIEWKKYLAPFSFFWDRPSIKANKKIIELLECTNEILKLTQTTVYKEDDINCVIRDIAKLYYTDVISFSDGYFVHSFKKYRPDIIIKEIETAIEYKLIRQDAEIGTKLDELLIDAQRYVGNHRNKFCIAVFCLSQDVKQTKKEIKHAWNQMHFPTEWELVIVSDVKVEARKLG